MIVREIIERPELIETFDWFNDYEDTRGYLSRVNSDLLLRFDQAYLQTQQDRHRKEARATPAGAFLWRMGMDYWDTESSARRVAERAAAELAEKEALLKEIREFLDSLAIDMENAANGYGFGNPASIARQAREFLKP